MNTADKAELADILAAMRQIEQTAQAYAERLAAIADCQSARIGFMIETAANEATEIENRADEAAAQIEAALDEVKTADERKAEAAAQPAPRTVLVSPQAGNVVNIAFRR